MTVEQSDSTELEIVAPLAGAWIEILESKGMDSNTFVAPLAGAWIEIRETYAAQEAKLVAPLAGAWIEIHNDRKLDGQCQSLPSRERGLKYGFIHQLIQLFRRSPRGSVD